MTVADKMTIQGRLAGDAHVLAGGDLTVQGAVEGNVKIEADGHAVVQGNVSGHVEIEAGASLHVQGTGDFPGTNRGLLILGGTFDEDWIRKVAAGPGELATWPGSLITRGAGRPYLVSYDGSKTEVGPSAEVKTTINADPSRGFLVYRDGDFTAVPGTR